MVRLLSCRRISVNGEIMKKISLSHFLTIVIILASAISLSSCIAVKKSEDQNSIQSDSIEKYSNNENIDEEASTIPAPTFRNTLDATDQYGNALKEEEFTPYDLGSVSTNFYYNSTNGAWRLIETDDSGNLSSMISVETYPSDNEAKNSLEKLNSEANANYSEMYIKNSYLIMKYSDQSIEAFNNDGINSLISHLENTKFALLNNPYAMLNTANTAKEN